MESPVGGSTLTTDAPMSAMSAVALGPASQLAISTTLMSSNGLVMTPRSSLAELGTTPPRRPGPPSRSGAHAPADRCTSGQLVLERLPANRCHTQDLVQLSDGL